MASAQERSDAAVADVQRQREAYGDTVASSVQQAPELTALNAIAGSKGIDLVLDAASGFILYADKNLDLTNDVLAELAANAATGREMEIASATSNRTSGIAGPPYVPVRSLAPGAAARQVAATSPRRHWTSRMVA